MKKIIALIMSVTMCLTLFPQQGVYASLRGSSIEAEAGLLAALDILPENAVKSLNENTKVTRREMAEYVVKAIGETEESVQAYTKDFEDTSLMGFAAKAYYNGFVSGYPDGTFRPQQVVTLKEAIKMILDAAGYQPFVKTMGNDMDAYQQTAVDFGLKKGIHVGADAEITVTETVKLLYNMVNLPLPVMPDLSGSLSFDSNKTILTEKFQLQKSEGIVDANAYTSLTYEEGTPKGMAEIGGILYDVGTSGVENYLGYHVEFYYTESGNGWEIVYANPAKYSEDYKILANEIEGFANNRYEIYDESSNKLVTKRVDATADVIYNGVAMPDIENESIYTPSDGHIILIDNDRDGSFDVISVTEQKIMVLSYYDEREYTIYGKYNRGESVQFDLDDPTVWVTVKNQQGKEMELSDLKTGDILEISQSKNKKLTEITVCRETVSGRVDYIRTGDMGKQYISVDGEEYPADGVFLGYLETNHILLKAGDTKTFLLTTQGKIAGMSDTAPITGQKGQYGYLVTAVSMDDETGTPCLYVKLLSSEGKLERLYAYEKIKIDGKLYKNIEIADQFLPAQAEMVYYWLNDDGTIKEIDTLEKTVDEDADTLAIKGQVNNQRYSDYTRDIAGKVTFSGESLVFCVPVVTEGASEDDFSVKRPPEYFKHWIQYTTTGYSRDSRGIYSEVCVVKLNAIEPEFTHDEYCVQKVTATVNADDELIHELEVITPSGTQRFTTSDASVVANARALISGSKVGVKNGDIIQIAKSLTGQVLAIKVVYRASTGESYHSSAVQNYYDYFSAYRAGLWDVYYKTEEHLRIVPHGTGFADILQIENIRIPGILVYDKEAKVPYRTGTAAEIKDYIGRGVASKIYMQMDESRPVYVVIYN